MKSILFIFLCFLSCYYHSQSCSDLNIQLKSEIVSTCGEATMTMLHDQFGRPFLYVANKEVGLSVYDISDINTPVLVEQVPGSDLNNLDVMNLSQNGNYLYLALGNTFNTSEASGMAIIDVTSPTNVLVTDTYSLPNAFGGSGIVKSDGNYAYLCAMVNGIAVINVQDKNDIFLESQFIPDFTFPSSNVDSTKINARGLELRNDTLFLCFDAGGFRIIDATNKQQLNEIGRYSNPLMDNLPRAYNNVILKDQLAYVAVDYCGLEVIDFSDPQNLVLHGWWNPYDCPNNNWFSSPVHSNEIKMDSNCGQIFLSTGKSDMMVLDVSNPAQPDSCNFYGGVSNNMGTWGIDLYQDQLFLSYVCAVVPFFSLTSGIKILEFNPCAAKLSETAKESFALHVNSVEKQVEIRSDKTIHSISISTILGEKISFSYLERTKNSSRIQIESTSQQIYFININEGLTHKFHF